MTKECTAFLKHLQKKHPLKGSLKLVWVEGMIPYGTASVKGVAEVRGTAAVIKLSKAWLRKQATLTTALQLVGHEYAHCLQFINDNLTPNGAKDLCLEVRAELFGLREAKAYMGAI